MTYRLLLEAISDIESIVLTIAADNPTTAQNWYDRLRKWFETLGNMPEMGAPRFDVRHFRASMLSLERLGAWREGLVP